MQLLIPYGYSYCCCCWVKEPETPTVQSEHCVLSSMCMIVFQVNTLSAYAKMDRPIYLYIAYTNCQQSTGGLYTTAYSSAWSVVIHTSLRTADHGFWSATGGKRITNPTTLCASCWSISTLVLSHCMRGCQLTLRHSWAARQQTHQSVQSPIIHHVNMPTSICSHQPSFYYQRSCAPYKWSYHYYYCLCQEVSWSRMLVGLFLRLFIGLLHSVLFKKKHNSDFHGLWHKCQQNLTMSYF